MIRKRRKVVNGVAITLFEKTVSATPTQSLTEMYADVEKRLTSHIATTFQSLPTKFTELTTKEIQTVVQDLRSEITLCGSTFTQDQLLGVFGNSPEDGSVATFDNQNGVVVWKQSPNIRLTDIENTLSNYPVEFSSDHVKPNKLHLPFAVAWGENNWGGNGRAGIFWLDPWDKPIDNYSIKMGANNSAIGESGYSYGTVGGLAMKFSNDIAVDAPNGLGSPGGYRGWVWSRGTGMTPAMALDSHDGKLTVLSGINVSTGQIMSGGVDIATLWGGVGSTAFSALTDVVLSSLLDAQVVTYSAASGTWVNATSPAGVTDHGNLNAASLLDNDHPQYRLTADTIPYSSITTTAHTHMFSGITATAHTHEYSSISNTGHSHMFSATTSTGHTHSFSVMPREVSGGTANQANSTFGAGYGNYHWFPGQVSIQGNELYVGSAGSPAESFIHFRGETAHLFYNHSNLYFEYGVYGANSRIDLLISSGNVYTQGQTYTNTRLHLSNPHKVGLADPGNTPTGVGADNVVGSGIWFGSGTSSHNFTLQSGNILSASTNLSIQGNLNLTGLSSINFGSYNLALVAGNNLSASTPLYATSMNAKWDVVAGNNMFVNSANWSGDGATILNGGIFFHNGGGGLYDYLAKNISYLTGASEFSVSDRTMVSGDVSSLRVNTTYIDTGTTATGTTILSGSPWDFSPSRLTSGYSWNFMSGATQWKSGLADHTIYFDTRTNYYHIIGIRSVYSGTVGTGSYAVHPNLNAATFLHAKTKNFSAGTYQEVGVITTLGGTIAAQERIDGYLVGNIWAPHLIDHDGSYYMFYAGVDMSASPTKQRIFVAKSHDPLDWSSPQIKFISDGTGPAWAPSNTVSCRDPFVIRDDANNRWNMYHTVMVLSGSSDSFSGGGGSNIEVIGISTATTLMGTWTLVDWVRASETIDGSHYGNGESPNILYGTDGRYYMAWSAKNGGVWTDDTAWCSASTLSINGRDWTYIPAMTALNPACEIVKSPYKDNFWILTPIQDYTTGDMQAMSGVTFTGAGNVFCYTSHTSMDIGYSAHASTTKRVNLTETLIMHQNEHDIHYSIYELDSHFPSSSHTHTFSSTTSTAHTHSASAITSGTFPTGTYVIPEILNVNWDVNVGNNLAVNFKNWAGGGGLSGGSIFFHNGGPGLWDYQANYFAYLTGSSKFYLTDKLLVVGNVSGTNLYASTSISAASWYTNSTRGYLLEDSYYNFVTGSTYALKEPTGFVNMKVGSQLGFTASTRYFEVKPTGGTTFDVMLRGKLYQYPATGLTISDVQGLHKIYFSANTGALVESTGATTDDFILNHCACAYIYWATGNTTIPHTGATGVGDERHGCRMDGDTHLYFHDTFGSRFESGFSLEGLTADGASGTSLDSYGVVGVASGVYHDEDLDHRISQTATGSTIPVLYQSGSTGTWFRQPPRIHPVITGTGIVPQYNSGSTNWLLAPVTANRFFLTHFFATNDITNPIMAIVGQAEYTTIANARTGVANEIYTIITNGLPGPEFLPIGSIIYEYRSTYTSSQSRVRLRTDVNGNSWTDFRFAKINTVSNINLHGNLAGLGNDDHPQYLTEARLTGTSHDSISASTYSGITMTKSLTLLSPTASENFPLWYTNRAITLTKMQVVLRGTGTPTVTWEMAYDTVRDAAPGTQVMAGTVSSGTSNGTTYTSFSTANIPANNYLLFYTTATGGTLVNDFHMTIEYKET